MHLSNLMELDRRFMELSAGEIVEGSGVPLSG